MEKLGLRLVPIDNVSQNRKYYTNDLQYYVSFGQQGWKVVSLETTVSGRVVIKHLPTLLAVKQYLREQYA
jgi:hypothetical protein